MKELVLDPDKRIFKKGQDISTYYFVKSGGVIVKCNSDDDIYISGDLVDPLSLVASKSTGDGFSVGKTTLISANKKEAFNFLMANTRLLQKAITKTTELIENYHEECDTTIRTFEETMAQIIRKKQFFLKKYPPLLFGEKPLYRKAVKQMQKKEYSTSIEMFNSYLKQYHNSPLERPAKLFLALGKMGAGELSEAADLMIQLIDSDNDDVSKYVRQLFNLFEICDTSFSLTYGFPKYSEKFLELLKTEFDKQKKSDDVEHVFAEEDKAAKKIFFILSGSVNLMKNHHVGLFKLNELKAGESLGEIQVMLQSKWDITAIANPSAEVATLNKDKFVKIITNESPEDGITILKYLLNYHKEYVREL
ncbi:MAG: cyclic nucleotide-binding domain-containing protein [Kosmotoga sp.]|nr:MAG: cyclic nucleotide-binding domain-containing protein [Kosmotoga sp.]